MRAAGAEVEGVEVGGGVTRACMSPVATGGTGAPCRIIFDIKVN